MLIDTPKKHLTTAQRIRVIEGYIKVRFAQQDDTSYLIPSVTMVDLATEATIRLGFPVNHKQLLGCFKVMEEMGFTLVRPKAKRPASERSAPLHARLDALEEQFAALQVALAAGGIIL
jgi:hypothetical protein